MSIDKRRSPRIVKRVPLQIDIGTGEPLDAYSAVINLHGALIVADVGFPGDTIVMLENVFNRAKTRARVIWSGGEDDQVAGFKIGIEFLDSVEFWGDEYDPETSPD